MAGPGTRAPDQKERVMQREAGQRGHDPAKVVGSGGGPWEGEGPGAGGNGPVGLRSGSELGLCV